MKLYDHQQKIIDADPRKTGLFLGTGSGKSLIALLLAKGRTLIIAPKTQVEDGNWKRELDRLNKDPIRYEHQIFSADIISKETFRRDWESLPHYDTVIIDEAHTVLGVTPNIRWIKKQPIPKTSQLFEALDQYIEKTQPERLYLCTATIVKSPMTVWGAAKILGKDWDWYKWRNTFYIRLPMPGREVFSPKNDSETKDRLARVVQKLGYTGQLSDYFDVPEQTFKKVYVEVTEKQRKRIKELAIEYPDPLVLLGKKHQVENGVLSGDEFNEPESFPNEKMQKLADYALEFPQMIVFTKYTAQIKQIATAMKSMGKKVFMLTGETKDRGALIAEANQCPDYVFIAQVQISAGWELPDCPVMIFASMSFSVVDRVQAEGRILRANALKKNLYITLVVKREFESVRVGGKMRRVKVVGIDEDVCDSIENKQDFNERIYLNL